MDLDFLRSTNTTTICYREVEEK